MPRRTSPRRALHLETLEPRLVMAALPGLVGEYYNEINLTGLATTRVDPVIDFDEANFGDGPAGTSVTPDDNYSERWTGFVKIDTAGSWTFSTLSNDGVRLWIDDSLVINHWDQHTATVDSATLNLTPGWHAVRLEHFQQNGTVAMELRFAGPGQADTVIPSSHLSTEIPSTPGGGAVTVSGDQAAWHATTLSFTGPQTSESASFNPFRNYRLAVTFVGPSGQTYVVPGYFAADGDAADTSATSGDQWRVHFVPDEAGDWTYTASFRSGTDVAVSLSPTAGTSAGFFDGATGSLTIAATDPNSGDSRDRGMVRYVGEHYLQYAASGEYYLKAGADSPENFLAHYQFDNTFDNGGLSTPGLTDGLHRYANHLQDYNPGDPTWQNGEGKEIIGALNYLASEGINSVYFLTYNLDGGDGADTWMWTTTGERYRFDVSKLAQWEVVFSHMDTLGIQLHVVTQETENDGVLDGGALGTARMLYYRELVARFAHHQNVIWNLGEENDNSDAQRIQFANYIKALDPYDHPVTVHSDYNAPIGLYDSLVGQPGFDATSIQGDGANYNSWAIQLRTMSAQAGRPWAIYGDEQGPAVDDQMNNLDALRKNALWGNLMGGGAGVEWYFGYQGSFGDVQSEDWRVANPLWDLTRYAVEFFQDYLPFTEMTPNNTLTSTTSDYVFAQTGEVYAIYLKNGGTTNLDLSGQSGTFTVEWYNPRTGGGLQHGSVTTITGGGQRGIGNAPNNTGLDWVVLVRRSDAPAPVGGVVTSFTLYDADTEQALGVLQNGAVINLATLSATHFNIAANVAGGPGSVRFSWDGQSAFRTENVAPYALFGNNNDDYAPGTLALGVHSLTATPYSQSQAQGTAGTALSITFSVIDQPIVDGVGLTGSYYNNIDLTGLASTRVDAAINFDEAAWGNAPPGSGVTADDTYSERWTGFVRIGTAGEWTFYTSSNDGVRLWIDGDLVIDHWNQHTVTEDFVTLTLSAGWHAIRLEHFNQGGTVAMQLSFSGPGMSKRIIPTTHLNPFDPTMSPSFAAGVDAVFADDDRLDALFA